MIILGWQFLLTYDLVLNGGDVRAVKIEELKRKYSLQNREGDIYCPQHEDGGKQGWTLGFAQSIVIKVSFDYNYDGIEAVAAFLNKLEVPEDRVVLVEAH